MASDAADRSRRARIGGLARSAQAESGTAMTQPARDAFLNGFYERTDPALPEQERQRQAEAARRLHFTRLSQQAATARRRATLAVGAAIDAEAARLAASADAL